MICLTIYPNHYHSSGSIIEGGASNLRLIKGCFTTISSQIFALYIHIFHKTEIQTVIFRCSACINLIWIKSYNMILVKIYFFMSENASFQGYFAEVSFDTSEGNQLLCFQNVYFSKSLFDFHKSHNQVKCIQKNKIVFSTFY